MAVQSFKRSIEAIKEGRRYVEEQVEALEKKREDLKRKKFQLSRAERSRDEVLALMEQHVDAWGASFDRALAVYLKRRVGILSSPHSTVGRDSHGLLDKFNPLGLLSDPAETAGGTPELRVDSLQLFSLLGLLAPLLKDKMFTIIREMPWPDRAVASEAQREADLEALHGEIVVVSGEIEALVNEAKEAGIEL
jgi:hypothetical protein